MAWSGCVSSARGRLAGRRPRGCGHRGWPESIHPRSGARRVDPPMKDLLVPLRHILDAIERIERYAAPGRVVLDAEPMRQDAIPRNGRVMSSPMVMGSVDARTAVNAASSVGRAGSPRVPPRSQPDRCSPSAPPHGSRSYRTRGGSRLPSGSVPTSPVGCARSHLEPPRYRGAPSRMCEPSRVRSSPAERGAWDGGS